MSCINQLKEYIIARGKWIDENIDTLMQFSHESRNKPYNR